MSLLVFSYDYTNTIKAYGAMHDLTYDEAKKVAKPLLYDRLEELAAMYLVQHPGSISSYCHSLFPEFDAMIENQIWGKETLTYEQKYTASLEAAWEEMKGASMVVFCVGPLLDIGSQEISESRGMLYEGERVNDRITNGNVLLIDTYIAVGYEHKDWCLKYTGLPQST